MQYYVIEIQNRADGNNNQSTTMRQKLSTGLQLFYERCAANTQTTQHPTATVMLIDSEGGIYKNERIVSSYNAGDTMLTDAASTSASTTSMRDDLMARDLGSLDVEPNMTN